MNNIQDIGFDLLISVLSAFIIVLAIFLLIFIFRKTADQSDVVEDPPPPPAKQSAPAYQLTDIDAATDNFNRLRIIGTGRLGTVYAAVLPSGDITVVKRIHPRLVLSNAGFGFSSAIKTLSFSQHPNVVSIVGFAQAPGERILVTEFVGMVSLDFYLHENTETASLLDWTRRFRVAAGAARGLNYLHQGMVPNVVHGCVKASNILLDSKFCAKLCDYGLSFLAPLEIRGLKGYVDDEFWAGSRSGGGGGGACKESDVYGFGVVLLELLSGRRSGEGWLVKWALPLIKEMKIDEFLDPRLVIPSDTKSVVRLARVALACVGNRRKDRPLISQVSTILNNLEIEVCN